MSQHFKNNTIACYVPSKHTLSGGVVIKGGSVRILSEFLDVRKWLVQQIIINYSGTSLIRSSKFRAPRSTGQLL